MMSGVIGRAILIVVSFPIKVIVMTTIYVLIVGVHGLSRGRWMGMADTEMKTSQHLKRVLTFGKYKGKTLAHVASFDPTYLDWMRGEGLCDIEVIHARDRGEYVNERRKLKDGHAVVFTGGLLTHLNGQSFHPGLKAKVRF